MKAERIPGGKIRLTAKVWSDEFEEERLGGWIKWYDQMHQEYGAASYKIAADALRAVR